MFSDKKNSKLLILNCSVDAQFMHWSVNPASHRVLAFTTRRCLIIECHRLTPTGPRLVERQSN